VLALVAPFGERYQTGFVLRGLGWTLYRKGNTTGGRTTSCTFSSSTA